MSIISFRHHNKSLLLYDKDLVLCDAIESDSERVDGLRRWLLGLLPVSHLSTSIIIRSANFKCIQITVKYLHDTRRRPGSNPTEHRFSSHCSTIRVELRARAIPSHCSDSTRILVAAAVICSHCLKSQDPPSNTLLFILTGLSDLGTGEFFSLHAAQIKLCFIGIRRSFISLRKTQCGRLRVEIWRHLYPAC